jgi:hypothetical protein
MNECSCASVRTVDGGKGFMLRSVMRWRQKVDTVQRDAKCSDML